MQVQSVGGILQFHIGSDQTLHGFQKDIGVQVCSDQAAVVVQQGHESFPAAL